MIGTSRKIRVHVHRHATDMRKSFDTLVALVREQLGADVLEGDLFLFVGADCKRSKVLFFDGTGLCLYAKRLSRGRFVAPWKWEKTEMTASELALFLEGGELIGRQVRSPAPLQRSELFLGEDAFS
jgi:transposase